MSYSINTQKAIDPHQGSSENLYPATDHQDDAPRLIAAADGRVIFHNQSFANLYGYTGSFEGSLITDIFIFDTAAKTLEDGEQVVRSAQDNKELLLQFDWIDTQNGQRFLVASAEKITARDKLLQYVAEKIEEKQNKKIDPIVFSNLSFDIQIAIEEDGSFISINQIFSDTLGYHPEDLSEKTLIDIINPDYKSEFLTIFQTLKQYQEFQNSVAISTCCLSKQGENFWIDFNFKAIDGKIYATGKDNTLLKLYRDASEQQLRKLAEAEAIGHIGQWQWKIGSENLEFSDQLYTIFGVEKGRFNPTLNNINDMIHRNDADRMMQVFQRAIIEQKDYDMDFRINRIDGETRFIRCEGRCKTDQDNGVTALYGIMQDVTETTRREMDIRKAKESVERAYAAKTQFLANMSHELRTPLNAVIGFSEMMERQLLGPLGNDKYLEYISGIRESGEHLLDLISDILDMSKIEAGKYELNLEKFNISKVIGLAVHMMEGRAIDGNIKVKMRVANADLQIVADRRAVMQMILNILSNAVKFSKQDGTVTIELLERDTHLSIKVKDNGIGIPANKLANITMPFEQAETDYTREYEGTGLGLAITKELTEIHGGNLHIESTIDVGTTVTIRLPYETNSA